MLLVLHQNDGDVVWGGHLTSGGRQAHTTYKSNIHGCKKTVVLYSKHVDRINYQKHINCKRMFLSGWTCQCMVVPCDP
jgi:hypothetical protein